MAAIVSSASTASTAMAVASLPTNTSIRCNYVPHRTSIVTRAVAAPPRPVKSAVPELLDSRLAEQSLVNFQEYTQATQMLNRLKGQASDLELLLGQLDALEASLDDNLLAPPSIDDLRDRQAKRAAKRAERRARSGSEDVIGASELSSVFSTAASTNSRSSAVGDPSPKAQALEHTAASKGTPSSDILQLEELFKLTVGEPTLPVAATTAPAPPPAAHSVLRPRTAAAKKPISAPLPAASSPPSTVAPVSGPVTPQPPPPAATKAPTIQSLTRTQPASSATSIPPAARCTVPGSLTERLERLLSATPEDEDNEVPLAGPSDEDLRALEREVGSLSHSLDDDDEDEQHPSALESSALAARAPGQLSVSPTGPSLLSLVPASAAPVGRSARGRQARRSARDGHSAARASAGAGGSGAIARVKAAGRDGTVHFLSSSSNVHVLSAELEREVTEVCRDYIFLEKVQRQCQKTLHRVPSKEEVAAAVGMDVESYNVRFDAGLKAKELLLKSNYRLVVTVCKKYIGKGMQLQDLVSEGVKGLLRSVETYDAAKGFRFGTYAHWWIRQAVSRSLAETGRAVRLPVHMIEQLTKLKNATAKLANELSREPTLQEISGAVGLPVSRIELLLEASRAATSMDTPMGGDSAGQTFKDTLQDDSLAADEEFGIASLRSDMDSMLELLSAREAQVLRLRFGLEDGVEWTLEDIGEQLGVTRERIRQLEAKALRKLQLKTIEMSGKLKEYSENMTLLDTKDVTSRTSSGTRKT